MALKRVRIASPNYSSRQGATVRLIVIHTAEGSTSYTSLGAYFANPNSQVSSHVGIDDTPNTVGEYVTRDLKAWTAAGANPCSVQAELCAFAAWDLSTWNAHPTMLQTCATWVAEEAKAFGIPLVRLTPQQAQSNGIGICGHIDLGTWGGNHTDPGTQFPMDNMIRMARGDTPPTEREAEVTSYFVNNQHHVYAQRSDGTVDHWWMDLGAANKKWAVETLPKP